MKRKLLWFSLFAALLCVLYFALRRHVSLEALTARELELRAWIRSHWLQSAVLGLLAYTLLSLVPGTAGKSLIYGWLYTFWWAVVIVNISLTLAAAITFLISRYVFRDAIQGRFHGYLARLNRRLQRDGPYLVLTLRLVHAPYTLVNYTMGATLIPLRTFWWTSQLGMLPGIVLFVYAGSQLPTLQEVTQHGAHTLFEPQVIMAFTLLALIPLAVRKLVERAAPKKGEEREEEA